MSPVVKFSIFVFGFWVFPILGQEKITLDQCLAMAEKNQLHYVVENSLKKQAELDLRFHKFSLFPSLYASSTLSSSLGRRLDPITNTFGNDLTNQQSYGLSANMPIFNGLNYWSGKKIFTIKNELNELEIEKKRNTIYLTITDLYFELCVLELKMRLGSQRIAKLIEIKNVQNDLIQAGRVNYIDTLRTANAQMNEEFLLQDDNAKFRSKTIDLNYYLGVSLETKYSFDKESILKSELMVLTNDELAKAQLEFDLKQLTVEQKQRKLALLPSLSLVGSLGTGYSSNNLDFTLPNQPKIDYRTQVSRNVYGNAGLQVNIPVFNKADYFKSVKLMEIKSEQYTENAKNLDQLILKQKTQYLIRRDGLLQLSENKRLIENNLKIIYEASMEEYKGGRITYNELQDAFMEWQSAIIDSESINLELLKEDLLNKRKN